MNEGRVLAVRGGVIFTGREVVTGHALLIKNGRVDGFVPEKEVPREIDEIDADGRLVVPGFVNAHHHAYSALATGMAAPAAENFVAVLERIWWRLDEALDEESLALSARWTALQCLQHGVTTVIDHHASYSVVRGALEVMEKGLSACGVNSVLCFEVSGRHGKEKAYAALEENLRHMAQIRGGRLIGLHAAFTLDDELLQGIMERVPQDVGFHVHCAEDAVDVERAGGRLIERLERFGILQRNSLLVHGVHLREDELRRVAARGAAIVHCPESNMHNGVGAFDLVRAVRCGVRVVCGTDGLHSSMLRSYAAAYLLSRHVQRDPRVGYAETRRMYEATQALAREYVGDVTGTIEAGARADVVVLGYRPHTPLTSENVWGHLLYGASSGPVYMTISGGEVRYVGGTWLGWDIRAETERCREAARRLWGRMGLG